MALLIDEIVTAVSVDTAASGAQQPQRPAQEWRQLANYRELKWWAEQDETRTLAWGNED